MTMETGQQPSAGTWLLRGIVALILMFLMTPVLIIVIISFENSLQLRFPPQEYSFRWYVRFLADPAWQRAIWVSLQVALITTVLATTLGFFAALALVRTRMRTKLVIYGFLLTPLIVPAIISAIAFYMTFAKLGASGSVLGIALGHTMMALPLVVIILTAAFRNLDERYEWAALSLGAGHWYTWSRITIPLAAPALISAALFAFLSSFDELLIALFLSGIRAQTLSVRIWNSLTLQIEPTIAAVSAFFVALTVLVLALDALLAYRTRRRQS